MMKYFQLNFGLRTIFIPFSFFFFFNINIIMRILKVFLSEIEN